MAKLWFSVCRNCCCSSRICDCIGDISARVGNVWLDDVLKEGECELGMC